MVTEIELEKITEYAKEVVVYEDGRECIYLPENEQFSRICAGFNEMIDGAHRMPAFGVSLNYETVKEIKKGLWVEFVFNQTYSVDEMPFEKLLIKAVEDYSGFNIIRYTSTYGYDGRCFYYDLVGKNMSAFCETLRNS